MLLELRDLLRRDGPQSLVDLEAKTELSRELSRDMLQRCIDKGRVRCVGEPSPA